jgi:hypothetical protein
MAQYPKRYLIGISAETYSMPMVYQCLTVVQRFGHGANDHTFLACGLQRHAVYSHHHAMKSTLPAASADFRQRVHILKPCASMTSMTSMTSRKSGRPDDYGIGNGAMLQEPEEQNCLESSVRCYRVTCKWLK